MCCSFCIQWITVCQAFKDSSELHADSVATPAATMNNEQTRRRKRGDVNTRSDVMEPFSYRLYKTASGKLPDAALIEDWFVSLFPEPNSILQCEFRA